VCRFSNNFHGRIGHGPCLIQQPFLISDQRTETSRIFTQNEHRCILAPISVPAGCWSAVCHSADHSQGETTNPCQPSSLTVTLFSPTHNYKASTRHHTLREPEMPAINITRHKWADNHARDVRNRIINSIINGDVSEIICLVMLHYFI
jgi:hypothetical protein